MSIKRKLTLIVMLTTSIALLAAAVQFIGNDIRDYRRRVVDDLRILTRMVGERCAPALAFRSFGSYEQEATNTLSTLQAKPHVLAAAVYGKDGKLFAAYYGQGSSPSQVPRASPVEGDGFTNGRLIVSQRIQDGGEKVGSIYLEFDMVELRERVWHNIAVVAGMLFVSGLIAFIVTARLQRLISEPILDLAQVANAVSERRDYTVRARKQNEDELGFLIDRFNEMLAQMQKHDKALRDINDQLAKSEARALAATEAKSQFLANVSHELRTPLNAIIGYSEMVQEELEDIGNKQLVSDLQKIHGAAKHQLSLINSILDLSKIEAGKMSVYVETFDLRQMVEEVATTVQPLVISKGNRFELDLGEALGSMRADQTKVRQVLFNLLSNAGKFTEHGLIQLRVRRLSQAAALSAPSVMFTVSDTGIGMTPEQASKVFQAFTQAETSTTRKYGGTGLGLALSKKFCEIMGGDLTATTEFGRGSSFTATLPVEVPETGHVTRIPATSANPATPVDQPAVQDGAAVLVIDDEPAARELLQRILAKEGYRVYVARSGPEGLALARTIKPVAITLDVMMPGMDGWSVLAVLKADPSTVDIPVIMLTIVDEKNLGLALGAADYLLKPIQWDRLVAVLEKHRAKLTSSRILIVEDDQDTRETLRRAAVKKGWQVNVAENGRVALQRLDEEVPGVILLDLVMPEMDGFAFVEQLRRRPECRHVPVIVVTAKDLTDEDRRRLNGQVVQVLQKGGHSIRELLDEIHQLLHGMGTAIAPDAAALI